MRQACEQVQEQELQHSKNPTVSDVLTAESVDAMIGYRLKETQSVLRTRMDDAFRTIGLTTPQYACLELLSRKPGATNSELARGAFVTRQTMNKLLAGLCDRGLVERSTQQASGRSIPTSLTPLGHELLAQAVTISAEIETQMLSGLSAHQRQDFHDLLSRCIDNLRKN